MRQALERRTLERGHEHCDYAAGMKHQLMVARALLAERPPEVIDRLVYDVVKEIVMHEVGHTLGLRHNFKASSIYSLEEIRSRRERKEATAGSVMDYNPVLFFKEKALAGDFVTSTIGPYDYWAIEYGYRPAEESKPAKDQPKTEAKSDSKDTAEKTATAVKPAVQKTCWPEDKMLTEIAARSGEPELAYGTDEDTTALSPDPRANRFRRYQRPARVGQNPDRAYRRTARECPRLGGGKGRELVSLARRLHQPGLGKDPGDGFCGALCRRSVRASRASGRSRRACPLRVGPGPAPAGSPRVPGTKPVPGFFLHLPRLSS